MSSFDTPLYAVEPVHAFSSRSSKFRRRASSLCSSDANSTLGDFIPTSTGATASMPKARANGVSRVADFCVVL